TRAGRQAGHRNARLQLRVRAVRACIRARECGGDRERRDPQPAPPGLRRAPRGARRSGITWAVNDVQDTRTRVRNRKLGSEWNGTWLARTLEALIPANAGIQ